MSRFSILVSQVGNSLSSAPNIAMRERLSIERTRSWRIGQHFMTFFE